MTTSKEIRDYEKKLLDSGQEEFGPCPYCEDIITKKDVGNGVVAIDFSTTPPTLYHFDCCLCQTDQSALNNPRRWEEITMYFYDNKTPEDFSIPIVRRIGKPNHFPGEYVGTLDRCPICHRLFDDDGTEVAC